LGERKRREPTRGGAPKGKNYPADTTETLPLQDFYFSSDYFAPWLHPTTTRLGENHELELLHPVLRRAGRGLVARL